jgi:hypothetical protein
LLEQAHAFPRIAHGPSLGDDAYHVSSGLERDLDSRPDLVTIRNGLGDRDL